MCNQLRNNNAANPCAKSIFCCCINRVIGFLLVLLGIALGLIFGALFAAAILTALTQLIVIAVILFVVIVSIFIFTQCNGCYN